jgi:hypothetical protein
MHNKREARRTAEEALRPYLGRVDLIVIANYFVSITSIKYFRRKYKNQKFIGFGLELPTTFMDRKTIILTTTGVARTISFKNYVARLKRHTLTLPLDEWPSKIDDGELTREEIEEILLEAIVSKNFFPKEMILACSQFADIEPVLTDIFSRNLKIHDGFNELYRATLKSLGIRGAIIKQ